MDFLNRAYSQLHELYRSMTPGSRVTAALLAVVVLLSLGYLATHRGGAPSVDLMHGTPVAASDLLVMEAALAKANLSGYEVHGTSIRVPRGQEAMYMAALADAKALPLNFGAALAEAIRDGNAFENSRQREQRIKIATQAELALIIRSMVGIDSAYVLYDVDARSGFNKEKVITATASVKPTGSSQLDETRVSTIRHLVAGAIAGLKPENVTVSDLCSGRTWYGNADDAGSGEENIYISLKRTYEQDLKAKILNALCFIPNVTVELSVALDPQRGARIKQFKRMPVAESRQDDASSADRNHAGRSKAVAQRPNTATVLGVLLGGSPGNDAVEADNIDSASQEQIEKESVGLTPTLARASVGVPISYFKKVWQERNVGRSDQASRTPDPAALDQIRREESEKIQKHVAQLLPRPEAASKAADLVTVTTFQDIPVQEPPAPDFRENLLRWLRQSWEALGMIAVALVSLVVLRSMFRARPAAVEVQSMSLGNDLPSEKAVGHAKDIPAPHARRFQDVSSPLREELSDLVATDPDAAVSVLRNWIGPIG